jgi:hypothetical protein
MWWCVINWLILAEERERERDIISNLPCCVYVCVSECVSVCERERERGGGGGVPPVL